MWVKRKKTIQKQPNSMCFGWNCWSKVFKWNLFADLMKNYWSLNFVDKKELKLNIKANEIKFSLQNSMNLHWVSTTSLFISANNAFTEKQGSRATKHRSQIEDKSNSKVHIHRCWHSLMSWMSNGRHLLSISYRRYLDCPWWSSRIFSDCRICLRDCKGVAREGLPSALLPFHQKYRDC